MAAAGKAYSKTQDEPAAPGTPDSDEQRLASSGFEPISLTASDHSENATSTSASGDSDYGDSDDANSLEAPIKCSAVHTLERDMPDFDYCHLVLELRRLILEHAQTNPGLFAQSDLDKCAHDDWFLSRFLLRQKLDLEQAFEMLKGAMRFNNESLASHLKREDFPAEFYQLGGLFPCGQDRKGNKMLYMRAKIHKKAPEIGSIVQAFIYYNIRYLDEQAQGRGISIVIDCSGAGLANADMDTLLFLVSTLKNYFPKGLSYFLVHELPWILKPFWHIAKAWIPEEHRQIIKFSDASNILEYIDRDNLPEYLGGTGGLDCNQVPDNCTTLEQAAKLWGIERRMIRRVVDKFKEHLPAETVERIRINFDQLDLQERREHEAAEKKD